MTAKNKCINQNIKVKKDDLGHIEGPKVKLWDGSNLRTTAGMFISHLLSLNIKFNLDIIHGKLSLILKISIYIFSVKYCCRFKL